ncbi:sigma-70 family RNA polymerase sigma factor [Atopobacter sp. AH10]|uniref:sigma-70 family RNA polymerase sigma factor n=1 Tax=Atopobacter sp. AH10 TaxID=2315861 RepID=UPI000EF28417|nr:sigma-70 family RNA polymerase sigma factor [Atopobacter sp. AH10]RLK62796.1 sigma-70 family RNA polymerase sigma factor [Atopobacter sp. AH10]
MEETVDELVVLFQQDENEDYFIQLVERFKNLIYKYQALYPIKGMTAEDYFQEACIVLFKSAKMFKKQEAYGFAFYFKTAWKNRLCSLMRKQYSEWRGLGQQVSIEDFHSTMDSGQDILRWIAFIEKPETSAIINESLETYRASLSPLEDRVFTLMLSGYSDENIANDLHLTVDQIGSARRRCKKKLHLSLKTDDTCSHDKRSS